MKVKRRIFVSAPRDVRLDKKSIAIKSAIIDEIKKLGYVPERFLDRNVEPSLATEEGGWDLKAVERVARCCIGAALIGLPFWKTSYEGREVWLPTDYCQYEGGVARACGLPILAVAIGIERRIVFHEHARLHVSSIPADMTPQSLQADDFRVPFEKWKLQLAKRRDFFLGYCSRSTTTAQALKRYIEKDLGATVLDWQKDFKQGSTILREIEKAASLCTGGIFLFTRDDTLTNDHDADKAVPRDNVVFEAGYFSHAKGNERVLIIQEEGAKMPADLGGKIYPSLFDKSDICPIKDHVCRFVADVSEGLDNL